MQRFQKTLFYSILVSQLSHVFCCVLPALVSVLTLLAGFGYLGGVSGFFDGVHEAIHDFELYVLFFSFSMLCLGWGLHYFSNNIDCQDSGCCDPPCTPERRVAGKVLVFASVLFAINLGLFVYENVVHADQHTNAVHHEAGTHPEHNAQNSSSHQSYSASNKEQ